MAERDAGNAGKLLDLNTCVLVVIDMQGKLLNIIDDKDLVLQNAIKLASFARIVGMPVVVTEQEKLGPSVPELAAEIVDFSPILKLEFDAGRRPEFMEALRSHGRNTVVICGIESHICVTQTVLHLLPEFVVHVIADACGSRAPENKRVALQRMREAGAVISSTEMFMYEALVVAGTDEFRETLKLVK